MKLGDVTDREYDPMRRAMELQRRTTDTELNEIRELIDRIKQDFDEYKITCRRRVDMAVFQIERGGVGMHFGQKFAAILSDVAPVLAVRVLVAEAIQKFEEQTGLRAPRVEGPAKVAWSEPASDSYRHEVLSPDGWVDMTLSDGKTHVQRRVRQETIVAPDCELWAGVVNELDEDDEAYDGADDYDGPVGSIVDLLKPLNYVSFTSRDDIWS